METLPENVLLHILSFLDKTTLCLGARLVCKQWDRIHKDPSLWHKLVLPRHITQQRLELTMRQVGPYLSILDCNKCEILNEYCFADIGTKGDEFPNMKKLNLPLPINVHPDESNQAEVELADGTQHPMYIYMKHLSVIFPNLEEIANIKTSVNHTVDVLKLQALFPKLLVIHDRPMASHGRLGQNLTLPVNVNKKQAWMKSLETLSEVTNNITSYRCIRGKGYVDEDGLPKIGQLSKNLTNLDLYVCSVTDDALERFFASQPQRAMRKIRFNTVGNITKIGFTLLAKKCPNLTSLSLIKCPGLNNECVNIIAEEIGANLTEIALDNSVSLLEKQDSNLKPDQLTDATIETIAKNCPELRIFKISRSSLFAWQGIYSLVKYCPHLTQVSIGFCESINDIALLCLVKLKNLKLLTLQKVKVTPPGVIDLILLAPALLHLSLYQYTNEAFYDDMSELMASTYASLESNPEKYQPNVLRSVTMRGVGGSFLQLLTVLCPNLSYLDLCDETTLSPFYFKSIVTHCESLTKIDISSPRIKLDASCLQAVAEHASNITEISFGLSLANVDISQFEGILENCPNLTLIWVYYNEQCSFDKASLEQIIKKSRGNCFVLNSESNSESGLYDDVNSYSFHFLPSYYLRSV